ncbi:hypothetical protein EKO04_001938 [Ascochyta lentis]|uniref:C2H2-type domain-containing protein n=1 Tax=Ascochyta lentis TaxID=205686 RepID=A0A8H7J9Q2_9PLEO|nr:hypothetical protein EKO04_001938 [Ascochyta lentis]
MASQYTSTTPSSARTASYCVRCKRGFKSEYAITEHIRDSRRHWACPTCGFDADGWDDLLGHCRATQCRSVCRSCNDLAGAHWQYDSAEYWQHVDDWNVCARCEEHFPKLYMLEVHNRFMHPSTESSSGYVEEGTKEEACWYDCLQCDRDFKTFGGMILHLESGSCSDVDCTYLDKLAANCNTWYEFTYNDYRDDMLMECELDEALELYFCPTCEAPKAKLSSLFQHVESGSCGQTLYGGAIGTLRRYLTVYL